MPPINQLINQIKNIPINIAQRPQGMPAPPIFSGPDRDAQATDYYNQLLTYFNGDAEQANAEFQRAAAEDVKARNANYSDESATAFAGQLLNVASGGTQGAETTYGKNETVVGSPANSTLVGSVVSPVINYGGEIVKDVGGEIIDTAKDVASDIGAKTGIDIAPPEFTPRADGGRTGTGGGYQDIQYGGGTKQPGTPGDGGAQPESGTVAPDWLQQKTQDVENIPTSQVQKPVAPPVVSSQLAGPTAAPTVQATQVAPVQQAAPTDINKINQEREALVAKILEERMSGKAPSPAELQLAQSFEQARAAAASQVASQRGGPTAAGLRSGLETQSQLMQQAGVQAAALRAQEQQQASQQYQQLAASGRAQDIATAGLQQEAAKFNVSEANKAIFQQASQDWDAAKQTSQYQWLSNQDYTTRQQAVNDMLAQDTNTAAKMATELGVQVDIANMNNEQQTAFRKEEMKTKLLQMGLDEARADKEAQVALDKWKAEFGEKLYEYDADLIWKTYAAKLGLYGAAAGAATGLVSNLIR